MKKRRWILVLLVVAAAIAVWFWRSRAARPSGELVASGTVEAVEARLGFQMPGRIDELGVREGDRVERGQLLARIDAEELLARREEAAAAVEAARHRLEELEHGSRREEIAQAAAAVEAARQRRIDAERDGERTRQLFEGGAVSREAYDKALLALDVASSQLTQAEEQLRLLEAGPRRETISAQRAHLAQAEAAVKTLDAALVNARLVAPFAGVVTVKHREVGEVVGAGAPVLTVIDMDDRWVRIYVPENRLGAVSFGQPAEILSDTFTEKRYAGEVNFIASQAEFTPKTVQTQEERVRLVYAVKVRITEDPDHELKPGLPVDVVLRLD